MERGPTSTRSTITRVLTYRTGRNTEQWGFDTFVARNSYKASALEYCVSIILALELCAPTGCTHRVGRLFERFYAAFFVAT